MLRAFLLVGLGGAVGSMARYGIGLLMEKLLTHPYPIATFIVNIAGCFIVGVLAGCAEKSNLMSTSLWLIAATGFCGGFTTFSSFAMENINLLRNSQSLMLLAYTISSVCFGLLLCRFGMMLVK
jgi:CrcB protein